MPTGIFIPGFAIPGRARPGFTGQSAPPPSPPGPAGIPGGEAIYVPALIAAGVI